MLKIMKMNDCETVPMPSERGYMIKAVSSEDGSHHVDVHVNVLKPKGPNGPYHYHEKTENVYWILEGTGRLILEGKEYILAKDDVVFIPPKARHSLSNVGNVELRLLEVYATPEDVAQKDVVHVD